MKKSIIAAGAASVALAAMPIVGAFAATVDTQTDTLRITISSACAFGFNSGETPTPTINVPDPSHTDGTAGAGPGRWNVDGTSADTLSATMINGTSNNDLGKTILSVYCNNTDGYNITTNGDGTTTTTVGALTAATSGNTDEIPVAANFSNSVTGWSYKVAAGTGTGQRGIVKNSHGDWATSANAEGVIAGSNDTATPAVPQTTANTGDQFTITYGVGINDSLSADTYTGSITYSLVQL